jgi:uncharacterized membrane protein YdjX (TVP38/TMEM64 family)
VKDEHHTKKSFPKGSKRFIIIAVSVLAVLVGSYFIFPNFKEGVDEVFSVLTSDDQDRVQAWVKQFGMLGPIVLILAMALQMFLLFIPNILLFAIAVVCYGPVWGVLICLIGVFSSSSLGYFIGKKLGPRAIDRFVSQRAQNRLQVFIDRYGIKAVTIFRLSTISADSLGFVAGILEMNYRKYILATMAGVTPLIILIAIYGNNGRLETALLWIGGVSLVCLAIYFFLDRKSRRQAYAAVDSKSPNGHEGGEPVKRRKAGSVKQKVKH